MNIRKINPAGINRDSTSLADMDEDKIRTVLNERQTKAAHKELTQYIDSKSKSHMPFAAPKGKALKNVIDENSINDTKIVDEHTGLWMIADYWNSFCEVDEQKLDKPNTRTRQLLDKYNQVAKVATKPITPAQNEFQQPYVQI